VIALRAELGRVITKGVPCSTHLRARQKDLSSVVRLIEERHLGLWELFLIAIGVSMDAFAVSVGKGLSVPEAKPKHALTVGLYFGGFQAVMPLIGYFLGMGFGSFISSYDHWIAFALLALIGVKMIKESRGVSEEGLDACFDFKAMLPLAVATSIDALAVGVTFAFLEVDILPAVALIGVVTFMASGIGLRLGHVLGSKQKAGAEVFGGSVLILIGLKILLEHLGMLG
jgi:manganese efflux pump family protein